MIALLVLAAFTSDVGTVSPPRLRPGFSVEQEDYPVDALRLGQQGRVVFSVSVDTEDVPHDCRVTTPVLRELDAQACAVVSARMRFDPARDGAGRALVSSHTSAIVWNIRTRSPLIDATTAETAAFAGDGTINACQETEDGNDVDETLAACTKVFKAALPAAVFGDSHRYSEATIVLMTRRAGPVAPPAAAYGSPIAGVSVDLTISPDGAITDCLVVENFALHEEDMLDPCRRLSVFAHAPIKLLRRVAFESLGWAIVPSPVCAMPDRRIRDDAAARESYSSTSSISSASSSRCWSIVSTSRSSWS